MSTTSPSFPAVTSKTIEDYFLLLGPIIGAAAGLQWGGILPGLSGFLVGAIFASLSKSLVGIGQNAHSLEDWLSFLITFLGTLGTVFSANMTYAVYGLIIGFVVKALGIIQAGGLNAEDILLAIGAIVAGIAQVTGNPIAVNAGIMLAILGKTLPSIGTNGSPQILKTTPTSPATTSSSPPTPV